MLQNKRDSGFKTDTFDLKSRDWSETYQVNISGAVFQDHYECWDCVVGGYQAVYFILFFAKSLSPENFYARIGPLLRTIINGYPDT